MFERFFVTSRGKMLEARAHAGGTITFTRLRIGSGQLSEGQSIEALNDLIAPVKWVAISSAESSGNKAVVKGAISNLDIASSFWFREIGIFANDPVDGEILYAYANAGSNADSIPAYSTAPVEFTFAFNIVFANTSSITVVADSSLAFVTHGELVEEIDAAIEDATADMLETDDIANSLDVVAAGKVLDARQGKVLKDAVDEKTSRNLFSATIPTTGWSAYQSIFANTIQVSGMASTDACGNVGPVLTGTETTDKEIRKAWNRIVRIVAAADGITVYTSKAPTVAIPIQMEIFR